MAKSNRHFYRCRSCCHAIAVEGTLEVEVTHQAASVQGALCLRGNFELWGASAASRARADS